MCPFEGSIRVILQRYDLELLQVVSHNAAKESVLIYSALLCADRDVG